MFYKLLLLLCTTCLCGNEFHIITAEHSPRLGMFAAANQVLGQSYLFEIKKFPHISGFTIDFGENGVYYDPEYGPNWWTYYFEPIYLGTAENATIVHPTKPQYLQVWNHRFNIPRAVAAEIIKKYIHVKPHIQEKVNAFVSEFFENNFVIGVHYRGTDKKAEAPRVAYESVFDEIDKALPESGAYSLFIATDEADFLKSAQERYEYRVIAIDAHRSTSNGIGVHFAYKHNYAIGEEALIDALLLSNCDLLIRTSSNLSLWSTYFNPNLPTILLNQRNKPTPEPE